MAKKVVLVTVCLILIIIASVVVTLVNNQANLLQPPGLTQRLKTFFNTNVAATADDHAFPELRTPRYGLDAEQLFRIVLSTARTMGWRVANVDKDNLKAEFEVATPLFRYIDDVSVQVVYVDTRKSKLFIRSQSRVGRGDLAANSGHIQILLQTMNESLGW